MNLMSRLTGPNAAVNVGALIASGLDINPDDFMNGIYNFQAAAGRPGGIVVNRGLIQAATGGSVSLIGGAVRNEGLIIADYGQVNLGAGRIATLDFDGDGLIRFEVNGEILENATGAGAAIENTGEIRAQSGQIVMSANTARGVFDRVINNEGAYRIRV